MLFCVEQVFVLIAEQVFVLIPGKVPHLGGIGINEDMANNISLLSVKTDYKNWKQWRIYEMCSMILEECTIAHVTK
jgi:hypothetical protein